MRAKRQNKNQAHRQASSTERNPRLPFIQHLLELRKRLFYIALSVITWGAAAYFVQQKLVAALLRPAHNQQFIYTSVGGGLDFLFRVCIYTGIAFSIPVIVYQLLKYLEPLIKKDAARFIAWGSVVSGVLALVGMAFGYFIGLPAALHFLLHQFTTDQIHPLLTIQSYMSFVTMYMLGSALLLQLPLLLILINRIKPLKPKKLLGYERWVILIAFILGGIMNPSPRIQDQLLLAGPMVIAYQIGIVIVWLSNRRSKRAPWLAELIDRDAKEQALRAQRFQQAQASLRQSAARTVPLATVAKPAPALQRVAQPATVVNPRPTLAQLAPVAQPKPVPTAAAAVISHPPDAPQPPAKRAQPARPRPYLNDFGTRRPAKRYMSLSQDSADAA